MFSRFVHSGLELESLPQYFCRKFFKKSNRNKTLKTKKHKKQQNKTNNNNKNPRTMKCPLCSCWGGGAGGGWRVGVEVNLFFRFPKVKVLKSSGKKPRLPVSDIELVITCLGQNALIIRTTRNKQCAIELGGD